MFIEAFILCYNESKIIRHTLNYYSKFCDQITILDNYSNDKSLAIIKSEYPNVIIKQFGAQNYREDILTVTRNNCWRNSTADYVIICDTDEFLYAENLEEKLELLKQKMPAICPVIGYEMFSDDFPKDYKKPITDSVKYGIRNYRFDKSILFSPKKVKNINYDVGAHSCEPEFYSDEEVSELIEFKLLHFKYLSRKYLYIKHGKYMKRQSKINLFYKWGNEYNEGKKHIDEKFENAKKHLLKILP